MKKQLAVIALMTMTLSSCGAVEKTSVTSSDTVSETKNEVTTIVTTQMFTQTETSLNNSASVTENNSYVAEITTQAEYQKAEVQQTEAPVVTEEAVNDYASAYLEICKSFEASGESDLVYNLIDVDGKGAPELTVSHLGYWVSMYTYADGSVFNVMDQYPYGAAGNAGYDYAAGQNCIHNSNSDYAGLIRYETYMKINEYHQLEQTACIEEDHYEDSNGNGYPDEDEITQYIENGRYYINGTEITKEEADSYAGSGCSSIVGNLTFEGISSMLK